MAGPEKPFSCSASGCGESFTNEDRLAVHARRHDMDLQLETKGATYVADQTPTPTRFIRNCEEVGLFQDLQNVNPFEETFKRAMETRSGVSHHHLTLDENLVATDDTLHTPHIFPHLPDENAPTTIYTTAERRSELNVNRQSSDEGSDQLNKSMSSSVEDNLTAVCLQDATDKHSNSIDKKMAALVGRKIFKRTDKGSTKLKTLTRQRSVDIEDMNAASVMIDADIHSRVSKPDTNMDLSTDKDSLTSNDNISMRTLQIPVISISETPKVDDDDTDLNSRKDLQVVLKKDFLIANTVKENNKLDIKTTVKQNFSKIISQRSIDLALIHFENESKNKTMDLNNISIEDIPESMDDQSSLLVKDDSPCNNNDSSHLSEQSLKRHYFKMTENKCISIHNDENTIGVFQESNINNQMESVNEVNATVNDSNPSDIPSVEMMGGKMLSELQENNAKGYELLLKWPDGKKVYLKEVFREDDAQNESNKTSVIIDANKIVAENSVVLNSNTSNIKRRLKEVIQSNAKQRSVASNQSTTNDRNSPKIAINNLHARPKSVVTLPENYVIFPQATQNSVPTMVRNNIQLLTIQPQKNQPIIFANNNFGEILSHDSSKHIPFNQNITIPNNFYNSGGIETFNGKLKSTDSPLKVNLLPKILNNSHNEIITSSMTNSNDSSKISNGDELDFKVRKRKNDKDVLVSNTSKNMKNKDDASPENTEKKNKKNTTKSSDVQERNRAAVLRYRTRKEAMNKMVKEKNEMLENLNQKLNERLTQALQEIQRLRAALALHADCSVSKT